MAEISEQASNPGTQASEAATSSAPATPESILDLYVHADDDHDEAPTSVAPGQPAVEPTPPQAPVQLAHPRHLLQMAADFGIPQQEAEAMSVDQLGQTVYHLNRQVLASHREIAREQAQYASRERTPPPSSGQGASGGDARPAGTQAAEEEISLGPNEQDFAPELVTMLKGIVREVRGRVTALEKELVSYRQKDQAREQETTFDRVDRSFARHETHLGKGSRREVAPNTPEWGKRMAVLSLVDRDASNATIEAKIDKAVQLLYGAGGGAAPGGADSNQPGVRSSQPPVPQSTRQPRPQRADGTFMSDAEIAELARWNNGVAARPSHRGNAPEPNGETKARESVRAFLDGQVGTEQLGGDDLDQFPE